MAEKFTPGPGEDRFLDPVTGGDLRKIPRSQGGYGPEEHVTLETINLLDRRDRFLVLVQMAAMVQAHRVGYSATPFMAALESSQRVDPRCLPENLFVAAAEYAEWALPFVGGVRIDTPDWLVYLEGA